MNISRSMFHKSLVIVLLLLSSFSCVFTYQLFTKKNIKFVILGDQGAGGRKQKLVAQAMAQKAAKDPIQFVILLGDNFYPSGVDSINDLQWINKFEKMYSYHSLMVSFYAVLGNHDYRGNKLAQVQYTQNSSRWRMPDEYYTFSFIFDDYTQVQFFAIDTTNIVYGSLGSKEQVHWLKKQLQKSRAHWKIVYGHHPIYSYGDYGINKVLKKILEPIFHKYKVDLYLSGHDHNQQLIKSDSSTFYIISGAGSEPKIVQSGKDAFFVSSKLGFAWFNITENKLICQFIDVDGVIEYEFKLRKPL